MPLTSFASTIDGFLPGFLFGMIDMNVRQDNRIAGPIKGLTSIYQKAIVLELGHGMSPSRTRWGVRVDGENHI